MTLELAVDIMRNLLQTALLLAIPILGTAMVVGLLISFVQSITSLQEQTLHLFLSWFAFLWQFNFC